MGINWRNVIKDQAYGMSPASAYYKEMQRCREEDRLEEDRRRAERLRTRGAAHRMQDRDGGDGR